jgi:hypothetical protein
MAGFAALPPEINSALIETGPGPAPLIAAGVAWRSLAAEHHAAAAQWSSIIASIPWQGSAAQAMRANAAAQAAWMQQAAMHAELSATQAQLGVSAFEAARAAMVPLAAVTANRAQLAMLIATNLLGQNTAAIAATEAQYGEMWAQDVTTMAGYQVASAAVTAALPAPPAPPPSPLPGGIIGFLNGQGVGGIQGLGLLIEEYGTSIVSSSPVSTLLALLAIAQDQQQTQQQSSGSPSDERRAEPFAGRGMPIISPAGFAASAGMGDAPQLGRRVSVPASWTQAAGKPPAAVPVELAASVSPLAGEGVGLPVLPFMPVAGTSSRAPDTRKEKPKPAGCEAPLVALRPPVGGYNSSL